MAILMEAVNDITDVEKFLQRQPKKPDKVYKLTATVAQRATMIDPPKAVEKAEDLPTYVNIINCFDEITKQAKEGDNLFIFTILVMGVEQRVFILRVLNLMRLMRLLFPQILVRQMMDNIFEI